MNTDFDVLNTPTMWHDETTYGRIIMAGRDAAALLQRLTSNDVLALQDGQGLQTVLTTPIGRIIDVLHVVRIADVLWVITSRDQGPAVYSHLKKNIFFNDHVTLTPAARTHQQFAVYGPQAQAVVAAYMGSELQSNRWHAYVHPHGVSHGWCAPIAPLHGDGWRIVVPDGHAAALTAPLAQLTDAEFQCWQIEAGEPAFGYELSTEYIPLEAGLEHAISFNKGCYVGQEIIARMESRGRRAKQLQRVRVSAVINTPAPLVTSDGRDAGILTRVVVSPRYGVIGLAYIKTSVAGADVLQSGDVTVVRCDESWQEVVHE